MLMKALTFFRLAAEFALDFLGVESHLSCSLGVRSWVSVSPINRQYLSRADFELARFRFVIDLRVPGGDLACVHVHPYKYHHFALSVPTPTCQRVLDTAQQVGMPERARLRPENCIMRT